MEAPLARASRLAARDMHLGGAVHDAGLAEALALGQALDILPAESMIYGVQPLRVGWSTGLSQPVQEAVPAVCRRDPRRDPGTQRSKEDR